MVMEAVKSALGFGGDKSTTAAATVAAANKGTNADAVDTNVSPAPLDNFAFLAQNDTNKNGADSPDKAIKPINNFKDFITADTLKALADKQDFTSAISSETLSALKEGKVEAILTALNDMSRASYIAALQHSGLLADNVLDNRLSGLKNNLPSEISDILTQHELRSTVEAFDNPVVRKGMQGIVKEIRAAHPDATPTEVAKQAQQYFTELAMAINPNSNFSTKKGGDVANVPAIDWLKYATDTK